jgi:hypothetical protein
MPVSHDFSKQADLPLHCGFPQARGLLKCNGRVFVMKVRAGLTTQPATELQHSPLFAVDWRV